MKQPIFVDINDLVDRDNHPKILAQFKQLSENQMKDFLLKDPVFNENEYNTAKFMKFLVNHQLFHKVSYHFIFDVTRHNYELMYPLMMGNLSHMAETFSKKELSHCLLQLQTKDILSLFDYPELHPDNPHQHYFLNIIKEHQLLKKITFKELDTFIWNHSSLSADIVEAGVDVNTSILVFGRKETLLTIAIQRGLSPNLPIVKKLIDQGADLNFIDDRGENALHHAIGKKDSSLLELLLSKGANPYEPPLLPTMARRMPEELPILLKYLQHTHDEWNTSLKQARIFKNGSEKIILTHIQNLQLSQEIENKMQQVPKKSSTKKTL